MAAVLNSNDSRSQQLLDWLPVLAGLLLLYVPSFHRLASWHWSQEEGAHGPIILAVIVWLLWRGRAALLVRPEKTAPGFGFALLVAGLLFYMLGRSQQISLVEIAALPPILAGVLLVMRGAPALRALWFPLLFTVFIVPLPGAFVDALTGPLKQHVSEIAEHLLYAVGYPVGRTGVVLTIGQYQLLVADACSGLQSMFSLSALGLLFLHLTGHKSAAHNALMLASILPIAFVANIVRVVMLILITYHFGDEAGQGFLHAAGGIVLLMAALLVLVTLDSALSRLVKRRASA